jgi:tripartite-type tricarboxylate transporter receptor subunit TctC
MNWLQTAALAALALLGAAPAAEAQVFPSKPFHIVVPYPAGGSADTLARALGDQLAEQWGQPVLIDNRPGAGSMVAVQYAQRAPADGYTVVMVAPTFLVNPMLNPEAKYDAMRDFTPVSIAVTSPLLLVVNASLPAKSLKELTDLVKASPGKLSFAAVGPNSTQQMIGEMLKIQAKMDWVYAPYPGGAPAVTALLGNHVTAVIGNYSEVSQQIAAGQLRALAVGTRERMEPLKDVPTLAELGYDAIDGTIWFGFVAPAGTPPAVVERIQAALSRALKVPAVREKLTAVGLAPVDAPPGSFGPFLRGQTERYERVIQQAGMKPR